jgi:hypothetical protein
MGAAVWGVRVVKIGAARGLAGVASHLSGEEI